LSQKKRKSNEAPNLVFSPLKNTEKKQNYAFFLDFNPHVCYIVCSVYERVRKYELRKGGVEYMLEKSSEVIASDTPAAQHGGGIARVLALATGIPYGEACDALKEIGRQGGNKFRMPKWMNATPLAALGFERMTFPSVKGQPRMSPGRFCSQFPCGTYIVRAAKHVFVVRDGVVLDGDVPSGGCVYSAWRVVPASAR
jgi:hypothetical protein